MLHVPCSLIGQLHSPTCKLRLLGSSLLSIHKGSNRCKGNIPPQGLPSLRAVVNFVLPTSRCALCWQLAAAVEDVGAGVGVVAHSSARPPPTPMSSAPCRGGQSRGPRKIKKVEQRHKSLQAQGALILACSAMQAARSAKSRTQHASSFQVTLSS